MLHRRLEIHERYLLHPRVLDVVEGLVGPDVLALQTMLFLKPPGADGQGYHQDSFHIITQPDTLIGAWIALDRADEENGCLWVTAGSQAEPIYPDADPSRATAATTGWPASSGRVRRRPRRVHQRARRGSPRATPAASARRAGAGRRCLLRRPRAAPLARQPQRDAPTARVRCALLRRSLARAVGRRAARSPGRLRTTATSSPAAGRTCRSRARAGLRDRRSGSAGAAARAPSGRARP